ncbi:hypothetical protein HCN51_36460 [Nonomuraea sp. FMUSA5-5]|uniref:Methyl-accepting transducer domain-containing protein n=1 Tax=Nonomuraea composti TaxID=2720023 RepID=A0ABX1BEE5_9ACTN|nr:hypothetical protein [Nonomuraea sp. FMUSA5-5]NJP94867.1 hypothetical protein [Nonomuraea sp. FMUSA5-5]
MRKRIHLRRAQAPGRLAVRLKAVTVSVVASLALSNVHAGPAHADPSPLPSAATDDAQAQRSDVGVTARRDRCLAGRALHAGGPEVKSAVSKALAGSDTGLHAALEGIGLKIGTVGGAYWKDNDLVTDYLAAWADRRSGWESALRPYAQSYFGDADLYHAPDFDESVRAFTIERQRLSYDLIGTDGTPVAGQAAKERATELVAASPAGSVTRILGEALLRNPSPSANDIAMLLQYGGFPSISAPPESQEFRTQVEALKVAWAACDSLNPLDPAGVMDPVIAAAHAEWEAEVAAQAQPRAAIVSAEVQASQALRDATEAMIASIGAAWQADSILQWQKYWQGQPADDLNRPKASLFTQAAKDLTAARTRTQEHLVLARKAVVTAKNAETAAAQAQASAQAVADAAKTPRGRGLLYAQQSAQVTKASAAAVNAAAKTTETAVNAAKATVADSKALLALAKTQAHALQAEFRRAAAEEAAAQAGAAYYGAAAQAYQAAQAATRAVTAQATAEAAEKTARDSAAIAAERRTAAELERAVAAGARRTAENERAKAAQAEGRAQAHQEAAAAARDAAEEAGNAAGAREVAAQAAEDRAAAARQAAVEAEARKDATAARVRALDAAAAAAAGTEDAAATQELAAEARTAADTATREAGAARAAADEAGQAAIAARAAVTVADAAAERAESAYHGAWAAATTTHSAAMTAHAAAADAIEASEQAAANVKAAEEFAKTAADKAVKARQEAVAARAEADQAMAGAVSAAGHAYAAAQAGLAARDTALAATSFADDAIAMGMPYQESDYSAAFAVLVGQTAKTLAAQQAAAAQAKAEEAAKAAKKAKELAAQAAQDAKKAAEAAAQAADYAVKAAASLAEARASAAKAADAAAAAKRADASAAEYDRQAQADAFRAGTAARDAAADAASARSSAHEAEKDAASARSAASTAEHDASDARDLATRAEQDADAAQTAAGNAQNSAKEADQAAQRAEEQERKEEQEARAAAAASGSRDAGPDLTADDETILRQVCGDACVEEFRTAKADASRDVMQWVRDNGGGVLLEVFGVENVRRCVGSPAVERCLTALVDAGSWLTLIGKIPAVSKAIIRIGSGIDKFYSETKKAKRAVDRLRKIIADAKKPPSCPARLARGLSAAGQPDEAVEVYSEPRALDPLTFFGKYTGRMDTWRGSNQFEIHVYYNHVEYGVWGSEGWFSKHSLGIPKNAPPELESVLKGYAVDFMRRAGILKPGDDIKGDAWKRPRC